MSNEMHILIPSSTHKEKASTTGSWPNKNRTTNVKHRNKKKNKRTSRVLKIEGNYISKELHAYFIRHLG